MISNRIEIKEKAKQNMKGKYGVVIPILLIFMVVQGAVGTVRDQFTTKYSLDLETMTFIMTREGNPVLNLLFSLLAALVGAIILYASARVYIQLARNEKPVIEEALAIGFKTNPVKLFVTSFLMGLYIMLWTLLLIIPGIVKAYAYSMTYYLLHLRPEVNAADTITLSKEYTRGHKMDLFILDLSYLLHYILGIFTFGIYWLWVIPKHSTARTLYYEEIYLKHNPVVNEVQEEY
ncbi:DUF975 family protein [Peloplasma aerotolerans]|uniref:DUF975 family protein n=1 Tax=Peloplasma aerotolerans TaxID=3044389 RepID=A0AAW6UEC7_9MOLU|nr:DUF975 family protein [Mariniplasma sp. M4Ah]MDI6453358.1 DUF975 family protein [Mariniplasma sp. M4Ah]